MSGIINILQLNRKERNVEDIIYKVLRNQEGIVTFDKPFHLVAKDNQITHLTVTGILLDSKFIDGHNEVSYHFLGQYCPIDYKTLILLSLEDDLTLTWEDIISTADDAPYMIDYLEKLI